MTTAPRYFTSDFYYHVYNCGVEKRDVFTKSWDYRRFLQTIEFYLHNQNISYAQFQNLNETAKRTYHDLNPKGLKTLRVEIIACCLMPNHFHLVLKPANEGGVSRYLSDLANSYTRYFNLKNKRVGALFQGSFQAKEIRSEESLLQVTRYVHLNPTSSSKTNPYGTLKPEDYPYSSYRQWINLEQLNPKGLNVLNVDSLDQEQISKWIDFAGGPRSYKKFVESKIGVNTEVGIESLVVEEFKPEGFKNVGTNN